MEKGSHLLLVLALALFQLCDLKVTRVFLSLQLQHEAGDSSLTKLLGKHLGN